MERETDYIYKVRPYQDMYLNNINKIKELNKRYWDGEVISEKDEDIYYRSKALINLFVDNRIQKKLEGCIKVFGHWFEDLKGELDRIC